MIIILMIFLIVLTIPNQALCQEIIYIPTEKEEYTKITIKFLLSIISEEGFIQKYGGDALFNITYLSEGYINYFVEQLPLQEIFSGTKENRFQEGIDKIHALFCEDIFNHKKHYKYPLHYRINEIKVINNFIFIIKDQLPTIEILPSVTLEHIYSDIRTVKELIMVSNKDFANINNLAIEVLGIEGHIITQGYYNLLCKKKAYAILNNCLPFFYVTVDNDSLCIYFTIFFKLIKITF